MTRRICSFSKPQLARAQATGRVALVIGYTGGRPEANELACVLPRERATILFNLAMLMQGTRSLPAAEAWAELQTFIRPEAFRR